MDPPSSKGRERAKIKILIYMKTARALLFISLLFPLILIAQDDDPPPKPAADPKLAEPHEMWGGKWDDKEKVFLRIFPHDDSWMEGINEVRYIWMASDNVHSYYKTLGGKAMPAGYSRAKGLFFRIPVGDDLKAGMLYDESGKGRMANLVKIDPKENEPDLIDLEKYGWKPGAIPPEEARRIIMGADADLLGPPTIKSGRNLTAADEVLKGARLLQEAKERWVKQGNDPAKVTWWDLKPLIYPDNTFAIRDGKDLYGRMYSLGNATEGVKVHPDTYATLREAFPNVWGDFAPAAGE